MSRNRKLNHEIQYSLFCIDEMIFKQILNFIYMLRPESNVRISIEIAFSPIKLLNII